MRTPDGIDHDLNAASSGARIAALRALKALEESGALAAPTASGFVNNHIHTIYSFSPYSPSKAVWMSRAAGLSVSGIVDHDSVSGVREYREAGRALGFPTTAGFELRSDHTATALGGRRTNNPDQEGVAYMTFHGLRDAEVDAVHAFLAPVVAARGARNRAMCARLADISGLPLDYDADVLPLSRHAEGGSVTERHLLCALSLAVIRAHGGAVPTISGEINTSSNGVTVEKQSDDGLFEYLKERLSFSDADIVRLRKSWETSAYNTCNTYNKKDETPLCEEASIGRIKSGDDDIPFNLTDTSCPYGADLFLYDLIGVMKASLVGRFYIPAGPVECPPLADLIAFARAHDIIITYPYLGDVTSSVTGDKKAQKFEDDYLAELFAVLDDLGVRAISYMPARNTREQVMRVRELADRYGMLQISGEDVNSPRQPFISEASKDPYFANLRETTWKLIAHERGEIDLV